MGLSTKVTIKYGDFGHEVMVPVIVQAMQEDLKSSYSWHLTCPDCSRDAVRGSCVRKLFAAIL